MEFVAMVAGCQASTWLLILIRSVRSFCENDFGMPFIGHLVACRSGIVMFRVGFVVSYPGCQTLPRKKIETLNFLSWESLAPRVVVSLLRFFKRTMHFLTLGLFIRGTHLIYQTLCERIL